MDGSEEEDLGLGNQGQGQRRPYQQRVLSEELERVNNTIRNAASWRELQNILETQSRMGNGGLDPFQLVAILQRATKYSQHSSADEQADFQQFIASGERAAWGGGR